MAEPSPLFQRWHRLSRADRKAILARMSDDQRGDLMAMIAADGEKDGAGDPARADSWTLFSPRMATALGAIEAQGESPPVALAMTSAGAKLLLDSAREIRAAQPARESCIATAQRRWRQWLKELDL